MTSAIKMSIGGLFAVTLFWAAILTSQGEVYAKSVTALEGVNFDVSISLKDNLKLFVGKDVYVHLRSGKTLQGYVKSVGGDFVHIEKLAGRDFYDALVRIEDISAIEAKFRDMK